MKVIYAQSPMYRKLEYNVLTQIAEIDGKRFVLKKALTEQAIPFVNGLEKNYQEMVKQYGVEHVAKGEFKIIDYEWLLPSVSKKLACFRAITLLYDQYQEMFKKNEMAWEMLLSGCGLDEKDIKLCNEQGRQFYNSVLEWSTKLNEKATAIVNF